MRARAVLAVAGALALAACGERDERRDVSARDVQRKTDEAADAARDYTEKSLSDFRAAAARRLDELERSLRDAQDHVRELSGQARQQAQESLDRAREQAAELRRQLDEMRESTAANWREASARIQRSLTDLQERIANAIDALRS